MTISISRLVVSVLLVILVCLAVPLFAQQTEQTTKPATVSTADLRSGMWCRVTLETPLDEDACSLLGYSGIIQEVTKDEIVLVTTSEFRSEKRVPFLAALPYIGRYITSTSTGLTLLVRRIPLAKIAALECRGGTNGDGDTDFLERIGVDFK